MAAICEHNEKGFKIVKTTRAELALIGSPCICDRCGKPLFEGVFIGALNQAFCVPCYDDWNSGAKFYTEDKPYEEMATKRFIKQINSQQN